MNFCHDIVAMITTTTIERCGKLGICKNDERSGDDDDEHITHGDAH